MTTTSSITVRVLLFARYAEEIGADAVDITVPTPADVGTIVARVRALPGGDRLPSRPLCAVNLAHADFGAPVAAGDELALLPPLAGG